MFNVNLGIFWQAEQPAYWTVKEWCEGFKKLIDQLGLQKVHIFGASLGTFWPNHPSNLIYFLLNLGGFLAQKFAEYTANCPRVASLILCNTFTDTSIFNYNEAAT